MNWISKIVIPVLFVLSIFFFNAWRISNSRHIDNVDKLESVYNKRLISLFSSNTINDRRIELIEAKDIISDKVFKVTFKDLTFAILLSEFKCNKCQEKELRRIAEVDSLIKAANKNINVIGITAKSQKNAVIRQRKILSLRFPVYCTEDKIFNSRFNFYKEFPQIIIVYNNIIQSCFFPIPIDNEFSRILLQES